jgi:hypothetical protein
MTIYGGLGDLWAREISLDGPKGVGEEWKYKRVNRKKHIYGIFS